MREKAVASIFIGDIHWSEFAPIFRSVEKDWLVAQERYVIQLYSLQKRLGNPPIFIAGDLFNVWYASATLINFIADALSGLKQVYAIPGNHDLPNHDYQKKEQSAYWTLVLTGVIQNLEPGTSHTVGNVTVAPFPHGWEVQPCQRGNGLCIEVALVHDYIWTASTGHKDAPDSQRLKSWMPRLSGYDVAVFADNHKPFYVEAKNGNPAVVNCGTFMRRHSDEADIRPHATLLYADGTLGRHYFDTRLDVSLSPQEEVSRMEKALAVKLEEFADELTSMHMEKVEFARTVLKWVRKEGVPDRVLQVLLACLKRSDVKAR